MDARAVDLDGSHALAKRVLRVALPANRFRLVPVVNPTVDQAPFRVDFAVEMVGP